jgi:hypothetical protein
MSNMERTENIDKLIMLAPLPLAESLSAGADMGAKTETKPINPHFHQYYSLYKQTVTTVQSNQIFCEETSDTYLKPRRKIS